MPEKYPKTYAEKLLMLYEGQTAPMHYHWNKFCQSAWLHFANGGISNRCSLINASMSLITSLILERFKFLSPYILYSDKIISGLSAVLVLRARIILRRNIFSTIWILRTKEISWLLSHSQELPGRSSRGWSLGGKKDSRWLLFTQSRITSSSRRLPITSIAFAKPANISSTLSLLSNQ